MKTVIGFSLEGVGTLENFTVVRSNQELKTAP